MPFGSYSSTPSANISIAGNNISEGGPPSAVNNAIRQLMADARLFSDAVPATQVILASATQGVYPNAAGAYVPRGLTQASVGTITPGGGGTNGTFDLTWTGGNFAVNPTGTFTVTGGALASVNITGPGQYIGLAANPPTPGFGASLGLSGAAVVLTAQTLIGSGVGYWVVRAGGEWLDRYVNNSGAALATPAVSSIFLGDLSSVNSVAAVLDSVITVSDNIAAVTGAPAAADRAQSWAESTSAPGAAGSKSAKSWADDARVTRETFPNYFQGATGNQGGNVESVGLFSDNGPVSVPANTTRIRTAGHSASGKGGGAYDYDASINALNLANYEGWGKLKAGGGGFKLSPDQPLDLSMFGWKTDFVSASQRGTDNAPVIARLKSFLSAVSDARGPLYRYTPEIRVPLGRAYTTAPLNFDYGTVSLIGVGQGATDSDGLGGSVVVCGENVPGVIINSNDTSGETTRPPGFGSTGSIVSGLTVMSLGGTVGAAVDGFRARGQFSFTNCIAIGFPRHNYNLSADLNGQGGNNNASFIMNCTGVRAYLNNFHFSGGDGNAITAIHLNSLYAGQIGINLAQFLANTLVGYHCEGNGTNDSGPRSMPQQAGAQCYYAGRYWCVYPGRAADAFNSTPGVVPGVWIDRGPGVPHPVYPTYSSQTIWTEGSALRATGANAQSMIAGGYAEPGQPPVFVGGGAMLIGGQQDAGVIGSRAYLYVSGGMLTTPAFQVVSGAETTQLGGEPETRLFQRYRTTGFFPWNETGNASGDFNFSGGNTGAVVWSARQTDSQMRIAKPLLASLRVESAVAPIATGAVTKVVPVFDADGTELGLMELKARA